MLNYQGGSFKERAVHIKFRDNVKKQNLKTFLDINSKQVGKAHEKIILKADQNLWAVGT